MLASSLNVDEDSGTLDNEIDSHRLPGQLEGIAGRDDSDGLAVDGDVGVIDNLDVGAERSQDGVVLQQVRGLLDTSGVVDGNDLQERLLSALPAAQEVAANATEAVDGNLELLLRNNLHADGGL